MTDESLDGFDGIHESFTSPERDYSPKLYEIRVRPEYKGRAANPRALALNGRRVLMSYAYSMDENDHYPGEFALMACEQAAEDALRTVPVGVLASGDVVLIDAAPEDADEKWGAWIYGRIAAQKEA